MTNLFKVIDNSIGKSWLVLIGLLMLDKFINGVVNWDYICWDWYADYTIVIFLAIAIVLLYSIVRIVFSLIKYLCNGFNKEVGC